MLDPELKKSLDTINQSIISIRDHWWKSFFNGMLSGVGSVFGVAIALFILGFVLNVIGVIPAFRNQMQKWEDILQQTQQKQLPQQLKNTLNGSSGQK